MSVWYLVAFVVVVVLVGKVISLSSKGRYESIADKWPGGGRG